MEIDNSTQPSHVAILVRSVRRAAEYLKGFGFEIGDEEDWDGEGTREIYVARDKENSLLLMEPVKSGAYQRALNKRGPGLHHLAIDVPDLDSYLQSIAGSGWLLHPISVKTIKKNQTAYLARPGFPALIEVQEQKKLSHGALFVDKVMLPVGGEFANLVKQLGLSEIVHLSSDEPKLSLAGQIVPLMNLY